MGLLIQNMPLGQWMRDTLKQLIYKTMVVTRPKRLLLHFLSK